MSGIAHPARSLAFLSRLHDGELSAAERAHFESHRAHCAECRKAASEFEAALAFYRTAGTAAPPSDLAARILRRLETSNPRRSPFGVVFGIDLKWAGAFTAAIIGVILGFSILERRQQARQIRVSFVRPTAAASRPQPAKPSPLAKRETGATAPRQEPPRPAKASPGGATAAGAAAPPAPAARKVEAKAAAPPVPAADRTAATPTAMPPAAEAAAVKEKKIRGLDEVRRDAAAAQAVLAPAPVRITVTALDGDGEAPRLRNGAAIGLQSRDRGRYVLVVGADGVPAEVGPFEPERKESGAALAKLTREALQEMRFVPGPRPRRLLVRIE